ncbi:MAG: hypothetical protein M3N49_00065 [Candidatus Eremiobacteraeota bacterium]|nr:hypothetical protein [Candidatus Eremiobacteraeota bacterium]
MTDFLVAVDATAMDRLLSAGENDIGTLHAQGRSPLEKIAEVDWFADARFEGGQIDLLPNQIELDGLRLAFDIGASFSLDLNNILQRICLPRFCIHIPFIGEVCTPEICINWPTIHLGPVSHSGRLDLTASFHLETSQTGSAQDPRWQLALVIDAVPNLQLDLASALLLGALLGAITVVLYAIPFIGLIIGTLFAIVSTIITIGAATGFLGPIITPFVRGLKFKLYEHSARLPIVAAAGPDDPEVNLTIAALRATVEDGPAPDGKRDLVIAAEIQ